MKLATPLLRRITALAVIFALSGCAAAEHQRGAADISPQKYQAYDCEQLGRELTTVDSKIKKASGTCGKEVVKDAIALLVTPMVLWPVLFLVNDRNKQAELAELNGAHDAIEQCAEEKQCTALIEAEKDRQAAREALVRETAQRHHAAAVVRTEDGES